MFSSDSSIKKLSRVIDYLDLAFSWDRSYVQKAQKDPVFAQLHEYEKFKLVIRHLAKVANVP